MCNGTVRCVQKRDDPQLREEENTFLRRFKQAGSTLFLVAAMSTFPGSVCNIYRLGCLVNLAVSILYHGSQVPARPKRPRLARIPSIEYEFSCSKSSDERWDHRTLRRLDKAAVCFICLYTGVNGAVRPAFVVLISVAAGFVAVPIIHEAVIGWALCLTLPRLAEVSDGVQLAFGAAAFCGPVVYFFIGATGAWCTPYRYFWHLCCGCLVAVGGLLNS
mmetsp:Transcript_23701/g.43803  ORF Transcript_23701/g.43803 Transcript_23701/m.43803 type:complete len:218 (+) Transcript_23701:830-1483(+)